MSKIVSLHKIAGPLSISVEGKDTLTDLELVESGHYISKMVEDKYVNDFNISIDYIYPFSGPEEADEAQIVYDNTQIKPTLANYSYADMRKENIGLDESKSYHIPDFYSEDLIAKKTNSGNEILINRGAGRIIGGLGSLAGQKSSYTTETRWIGKDFDGPKAVFDGVGKGGVLTGDITFDTENVMNPNSFCMVSTEHSLLRVETEKRLDGLYSVVVRRMNNDKFEQVVGSFDVQCSLELLPQEIGRPIQVLESLSPHASFSPEDRRIVLTLTHLNKTLTQVMVGVYESYDDGATWALQEEIETDLFGDVANTVREMFRTERPNSFIRTEKLSISAQNRTRICIDENNKDRILIVAAQTLAGKVGVHREDAPYEIRQFNLRMMQSIMSTNGGRTWNLNRFDKGSAITNFEDSVNRVNKSIHSSLNLYNMFDDGSNAFYYATDYETGGEEEEIFSNFAKIKNNPYFSLHFDRDVSDFIVMKSVHKRETINTARYTMSDKQKPFKTSKDTIFNTTQIRAITPNDYGATSYKLLFTHKLRQNFFGGEKAFLGRQLLDPEFVGMSQTLSSIEHNSYAPFLGRRYSVISRARAPFDIQEEWTGTSKYFDDTPFSVWGDRRTSRGGRFQNIVIGEIDEEDPTFPIYLASLRLSGAFESYKDLESSELLIESMDVAVNSDGERHLVMTTKGKVSSIQVRGNGGGFLGERARTVLARDSQHTIIVPFHFEHKSSAADLGLMNADLNKNPSLFSEDAGNYMWIRGSMDVRRQSICSDKYHAAFAGRWTQQRHVISSITEGVAKEVNITRGAFRSSDGFDEIVSQEGGSVVCFHHDELFVTYKNKQAGHINYVGNRWSNIHDSVPYTYFLGPLNTRSELIDVNGVDRVKLPLLPTGMKPGHYIKETVDMDVNDAVGVAGYNKDISTEGPYLKLRHGALLERRSLDVDTVFKGDVYSTTNINGTTASNMIGLDRVPHFTYDESPFTGFFKTEVNIDVFGESQDLKVMEFKTVEKYEKSTASNYTGAQRDNNFKGRIFVDVVQETLRTRRYGVYIQRSSTTGLTTVTLRSDDPFSPSPGGISSTFPTEVVNGRTNIRFKIITDRSRATLLFPTEEEGRTMWREHTGTLNASVARSANIHPMAHERGPVNPERNIDPLFNAGYGRTQMIWPEDVPRVTLMALGQNGNTSAEVVFKCVRHTFGEMGQENENPVYLITPQIIQTTREFRQWRNQREAKISTVVSPLEFERNQRGNSNFDRYKSFTRLNNRTQEGRTIRPESGGALLSGRKLKGRFIVPPLKGEDKLPLAYEMEGVFNPEEGEIKISRERERVYRGEHVYDDLARRPNFKLGETEGGVLYSGEEGNDVEMYNNIYFTDMFIPEEQITARGNDGTSTYSEIYFAPKVEFDITGVGSNYFTLDKDASEISEIHSFTYCYVFLDENSNERLVKITDPLSARFNRFYFNKRYQDQGTTPIKLRAYPKNFSIFSEKGIYELRIANDKRLLVNDYNSFGGVYFTRELRISNFITDVSFESGDVMTSIDDVTGLTAIEDSGAPFDVRLQGMLPYSNHSYVSSIVRGTLHDLTRNSYFILEVAEKDHRFFMPVSADMSNSENMPLSVSEDSFTLTLHKS